MFIMAVKTENDAFRNIYVRDKEGNMPLDTEGYEVRRLLSDVARKLQSGCTKGVLTDIHGNEVGNWSYE